MNPTGIFGYIAWGVRKLPWLMAVYIVLHILNALLRCSKPTGPPHGGLDTPASTERRSRLSHRDLYEATGSNIAAHVRKIRQPYRRISPIAL